MKICVYGAGAIGGAMAARLARAGHETSVIARGPHLAAIRAQGLRCESPTETFTARVAASDNAGEFGPQDAVIVTVKAHTMPAIVPGLKLLLGPTTSVVYAVNGIPWWYFYRAGGAHDGKRIERLDPGGQLWDEIGIERTVGCVLNFPSSVPSPGVVRHSATIYNLSLGEPGGGETERLSAIADALRSGGFTVQTKAPIRNEIWVKAQRLISTSTITALTSMTVAAASSDLGLRPVFRSAMRELAALGAAYGIVIEDTIEACLEQQSKVNHRPSMLQDLEAGRSLEIDAQLTVPQELARAAGVATPTLDILIALIKGRARQAGLYKGDSMPSP